jgi:phosphoglycolate phosphatase-like HAD superfamily hydrolase
MKLLLFDVDGTLISTGGAGVRALDKSFMGVYGLEQAMDGIRAAGKTDPAIVREIFFKKLKRDPSAKEIAIMEVHYLAWLEHEVRGILGYKVLPGVGELLESLSRQPDVLLALGTGNWERGARIKLEVGHLNEYFAFGGFGSDAEARADVLSIAVRRAEERTGRLYRGQDVFVIGDTLLDIRAGRAIGATTVAVGGGHGTEGELLASDPDIYLKSCKEAGALLEQLNIKHLEMV